MFVFRLSILGKVGKSSALFNSNYTGADKPGTGFIESFTIKDFALYKASTR